MRARCRASSRQTAALACPGPCQSYGAEYAATRPRCDVAVPAAGIQVAWDVQQLLSMYELGVCGRPRQKAG